MATSNLSAKLTEIMLCAIVAVQGSTALAQSKPYHFDPQRKPDTKILWKDQRSFPTTAAIPLTASRPDPEWETRFTVPGVVTGPVYTMVPNGTDLYVGGAFATAGGKVANNIAKWDGSQWTSIGAGENNGVNGLVYGIAVADGKIFVSGNFDRAGQTVANGIAYWDGTSWHRMGEGRMNGLTFVGVDWGGNPDTSLGSSFSIIANDSVLFVGGTFNRAGGVRTSGIARWTFATSSWSDVGTGVWHADSLVPTMVLAMAFSGTDLLVGGNFLAAGTVPARNFAKWNLSTRQWSEAGGGVNDWVEDIALDGSGNVFVVGFFDSVGSSNLSAPGIARWDGTQWHNMNFYTPDPATAPPGMKAVIAVGTSVYVGGWFDRAGGVHAKSIARWDGSTWSQPGGGIGYPLTTNPGGINSLAIHNDGQTTWLYAGGTMLMAGDSLVANITRLRLTPNSVWERLDDNTGGKGFYDGAPVAVVTRGDTLFAGGNFTVVGGTIASSIARWDGVRWENLQEGINGSVLALAADDRDLFVGGHFGRAGTREAYHIARWDGANWHPLGIGVGGINPMVTAIALDGDHVYVGGPFEYVGDSVNYVLPASSIARWSRVTQRWDSLGSGLTQWGGPGIVASIAVNGSDVVAGGFFGEAGSQPVMNIARWNGAQWSSLGTGGDNGVNGMVGSIVHTPGGLLVGGGFTMAGTRSAKGLALWDGTSWSEFAGGVSGARYYPAVYKIRSHRGKLVVVGNFVAAGLVAANNMALWDGQRWLPFGQGTEFPIADVSVSPAGYYIAGDFFSAGGVASVRVGKWREDLTSVPGEGRDKPVAFSLGQNYPNPFNPTTSIGFTIPRSGWVTLKVFNILGQEVRTLLNEAMEPGTHAIRFDARDLSSGVYVYRLLHNRETVSRKMILAK